MNRLSSLEHITWAGILAAAVFTGGCAGEPEVPPAQTQAGVTREVDRPTTVTGCLRAGDAANTFVLTTAQTVDGTPAATYQLTATGVDLSAHVGKRVEANGVVQTQSDIATRQPAQPADNAQGTAGTAGTPTVQTATELSIRTMTVSTVKPVAGECEL
jgi:hypothetical protein